MKALIILSTFSLFFSSCSQEQEVGKLKLNATAQKIERIHSLPKVDLLFVVESGLTSYRQELNRNMDALIAPLKSNRSVDLHVGVITSTHFMGDNVEMECGNDGDGRLLGDPSYVSAGGEEILESLGRNLLAEETVTCFPLISPHQPFEAVRAALSSPMVEGHNRGFYREEASLVVIFLAERDGTQEELTVEDFRHFLISLKDRSVEKVALYGAIVEKNDPLNCLGEGEATTEEIEKAISSFSGLSFNLCTPSFREELAKIGRDLNRRFGKVFIPLDHVPATGTITVEYQGRLLSQDSTEEGWTYDPNRKGIRLKEDIPLQDRGRGDGTLTVRFFPSKPESEEEE
ncbi:MAG: hypothetical protein OXB88_00780 [Bacteriovoracales bacterium]|nr:hypothetical protein [Bacteriovoracales bacterium]